MKQKVKKDDSFIRRSRWTGLMLVLVAAVTLEATSLIQFFFSQNAIRQEAALRAESELESTRLEILNVIDQAESAVRNNIWIARWCLDFQDSLSLVTSRLVSDNPVVMGSTIALVPGRFRRYPLCAPYSYQEPGRDSVLTKSLATPEYDYPSQEWFTKPIELEDGYWSEPYVDEGGGDVLMTTFSMPIRDEHGVISAVLTADISLDWLTDLVGNIKVYPKAFSILASRSGKLMVCPAESLIMHRTVQEAADDLEDTAAAHRISRAMLGGETGSEDIVYQGKVQHVFYSQVERTGWSMSIVIPDSDINGHLRRVGGVVSLLQLLGLLMLALILLSYARNQRKNQELTEKKNKIESELHIARGIQMAMLPKIFPPFPERKDLDLFASIVPAKEVGGDLYDFFIRDEKLLFCIADVSGKGVPASLVMAVTRSLFRTIATHQDSPKQIIQMMNDAIADNNESNMFVTLFCGTLDLKDGHLVFCNAGHNAPEIISDGVRPLDVLPNLPVGVMGGMDFKEQETVLHEGDTIFLYTDGLSEAENQVQELFGEQRLEAALQPGLTAVDQLRTMHRAVHTFVGEAEQSDDLTMLCIRFLGGNAETAEKERSIVLRNDIGQISRLADFVGSLAREEQLSEPLTVSLNLALEEAVTNVIMYAYPQGQEGRVGLQAVRRPDALEFTLTDSGKPFDPTAAPEADTSLGVQERPIGGLGIFLVRKIMDTVAYRRTNGKNILTMIKHI